MGFECMLVFDNPHDVPEDIIKTVFEKVSTGETCGKVGKVLYNVRPEVTNEFGCPVERGMIEFFSHKGSD